MKKSFNFYIIAWMLCLGLFNVFAFVIPSTSIYDKYTGSFWAGYVLISLALVCQLVCAAIIFKDNNAKKMFYNISLIRASYVGLIFSVMIGGICMVLSFIPYWIGIAICGIVLALTVFSIVKADIAINEVERIDAKVKTQTFFIKSLTVDAETLMASAKDDAIKAECRKVAEALRYSDPMSSDALASAESAITIKFAQLQSAVQANDKEKAIPMADELLILIADRNKKCKLLK